LEPIFRWLGSPVVRLLFIAMVPSIIWLKWKYFSSVLYCSVYHHS
jgi:hypothetical protein